MWQQFKQFFRFAIVGAGATLLNSGMFILLVELFRMRPLISNLLAFSMAFFVSYLGHSWWTFKSKQHSQKKLIKFLIVSLFGLLINSGFVWLFMHVYKQSAFIAVLPMIFFTPIIIFVINKFWVFKL
jgi:putative flippase GtrA